MKKVILGVLALMFAMALVVGGYILFTGRDLQQYAVEDVVCPYSWKELRDGTYRLEIDATAYPDHSWSVECYPKNVVAAAEAESADGTVAFSILPLNMGQTYVQVYCEQTDPFTVRVFEIGMQISVSEDGKITVESTEEKAYNGISTAGEESDYPIQWWTNTSGAINLLIMAENGGSWEAVDYDAERIEVAGPFYRQGSCAFEIRGKQEGFCPLTIYDGADEGVRLEIEVAEDLSAAVTESAVVNYTVDRSEEHRALEAAVGRTLVLPQQAVVTSYYVTSDDGFVEFRLQDTQWRWEINTGSTEENAEGDMADYASETKTASVSGVMLTAYRFKDGVSVFWTESGCAMTLFGDIEVSLDDALTVAQQIVEENHGQ